MSLALWPAGDLGVFIEMIEIQGKFPLCLGLKVSAGQQLDQWSSARRTPLMPCEPRNYRNLHLSALIATTSWKEVKRRTGA